MSPGSYRGGGGAVAGGETGRDTLEDAETSDQEVAEGEHDGGGGEREHDQCDGLVTVKLQVQETGRMGQA